MKLLLLGGTIFLGKHLAEAALAAGHEVTLFHRGVHGRDLFPAAEHVYGDRDGGLGPLRGRSFDAVIDMSGYLPRLVRESAALLAKSAGHYTFISSISAYASFTTLGMTEDALLAQLPSEGEENVGEWYGALKARCEQEVSRHFPGRDLLIRPGLIVGPDDPSDRFTYWVARLAQAGEALAPGRPSHPVQVIDVRDLAAWTLSMVERGAGGAYNAVGPKEPTTMGELLTLCREAGGGSGAITWVTEEFLAAQSVTPWSEMPLFVPESDPDSIGMDSVSIEKALGAGLALRPLRETVADTLHWDVGRPRDLARRAGISPEREAQLLRAWHGANAR
ncbi:MAG: hypothetical protein M0Z66_00025 [Thermaerobacter sp.]|nr:hypothetical protein [Thermaerobacter sp.]